MNADDARSGDVDTDRFDANDDADCHMDTESDRIRADIDRTRAQMDETVDELQHRMSLDYMARSGVAMARDGAVAGARRLGTMVLDHPLPTAVIAGGIIWMILRKTAPSHEASDLGQTYAPSTESGDASSTERGRVSQAVHSAAEAVKHTAQRAGGAVKEGAATVGHSVAATAGTVSTYTRDKASHIAHQVQHGAQRGGEMFVQTIERHPLPVVAAFFTLGLAAGLAVPSTRKEDRLLGGVRDDLVDRAQAAGKNAIRQGEMAVRQAADAVEQRVGN